MYVIFFLTLFAWNHFVVNIDFKMYRKKWHLSYDYKQEEISLKLEDMATTLKWSESMLMSDVKRLLGVSSIASQTAKSRSQAETPDIPDDRVNIFDHWIRNAHQAKMRTSACIVFPTESRLGEWLWYNVAD